MRKFWLILLMLPLGAIAQTQIDVTFRYVLEPGFTPVRVFVPGAFNNWGPNASGVIATGAVSQMELDASGAFYKKTIKLTVGQSYMYKVHFHKNTAGTDWQWVLDPLNPKVNTADNNNSVLDVVSPMAFQPAREVSATDEVKAFSAGLFSTSAITQMTFEINGVAQADAMNYYSATTGIFRYVPTTPLPPGTGFKVTFTDAAGKTATAELKQDPPPVVTKAARPSYAVEGINYNPLNPTEATLVLYAPKKQYVYAIGDFSNWEKQAKYLMMKDSTAVDQVYWWVTLTGLTPGTEYAYQYLVDGKIRIADPFANKVLDPSNDQYIPTTTYPSLKAYPAGKTSYHVSVLQTNKPKYTWTATNYQRPAQHKLVIYELHIRDFIAARNFKAIQDTLSYLKKLGVNAIEFMPVQEFDGNDSWGYNPAFYFALDKYYGTELAFKQFIDTCHQNGIAVIMDVVYNHQTGTSPFARLYNESPTGDPSANVTASNYWLNTTARHPFNVFIDANHESWQMQRLLDRANQYWLTEFKIDGFRYDLSKGFTQTYSTDATMSNYDASRIRNLKRMADVVWATDPTAYVILEHFATNAEEKELAEYGTTSGKPGMMLWGNSNYTYNEATMANDAMCWHFDKVVSEIEADLSKRFSNRASILKRAFEAHKVGNYELSIPAFLAQADGMGREALGKNISSIYTQRQDKKAKIKEAIHSFESEAVLGSEFLDILLIKMPLNASENDTTLLGRGILNRNEILHGTNTDYASFLNSCRAISWLDYVAFFHKLSSRKKFKSVSKGT